MNKLNQSCSYLNLQDRRYALLVAIIEVHKIFTIIAYFALLSSNFFVECSLVQMLTYY